MVVDLVFIGVAIAAGPLQNSVFILILSSAGGLRNGLAFIVAWLVCLIAVLGAVLLTTGGTPPAPRTAPSVAALSLKLLLGLALVVYGERKRRRGSRPRRPPKWLARLDHISGWGAAGVGVLLQPWTLVAAGGATVVQARLSSAASYLVLAGFVLLATSALMVMEVYATLSPVAAGARLGAVRAWIDSHQDQAVVAVSLIVGLWLTGASAYALVR